jgi:hypothetical protein
MRFYFFFALTAVLLAGRLPAEDAAKTTVELRPPSGSQADYDYLEKAFGEPARGVALSGMTVQPTPSVRAALDQQQRGMKHIFQASWPRLEGYTTLNRDNQDILVANWKSDNDGGPLGRVSVWDTPLHDVFVFEVDNEVLNSAERIKALVDGLLLWSTAPLQIARTHYYLLLKEPSALGVVGSGNVVYERFSALPNEEFNFFIAGYRLKTGSYLCFFVGKKLVDEAPNLLPERFPPLKARIRDSSTDALLQDLDSPGSQERDNILIHELVSRKLSDDEFDRLVSYRENPGGRAYDVVAEIVAQHKLQLYEKRIRSFLAFSMQGHPKTDTRPPAILRALWYARDVDFSDLALAAVRDGSAVYDGLTYLRTRGDSRHMADELQDMPVPDEWKDLRDQVARDIRDRASEKNNH